MHVCSQTLIDFDTLPPLKQHSYRQSKGGEGGVVALLGQVTTLHGQEYM